MHKIVYLPLADDDILEAVDFLAGKMERPDAAEALLNEIDDAEKQLSKYPYSGEPYYSPRSMRREVRKLPVRGYVLYYSVTEETVEILRVIHGKKDRTQIVI